MRNITAGCIIIVLIFIVIPETSGAGKIVPGRWLRGIKVAYDHNGEKGEVPVQIYFPKNYVKSNKVRTLIALHGYRASLREWEVNSHIEYFAKKYNIVIVCPGMTRSIYASRFFPESVNKWKNIPGALFIGKFLIPYLQDNFSLASDRKRTAICGYSMGARGAMIVASLYNSDISVVTGMSGPYDQLSMIRSRALTNIYGKYRDFSDRWKNTDNIMKLAERLKDTSIYLYHGEKDSSVKWQHSFMLMAQLNKLKKEKGGYNYVVRVKKYHVHAWKYWKMALPEMMAFIDKNLSK